MRGGMRVPWGDGCSRGMGVPWGGWQFLGDGCSRGMGVPGGWVPGGWVFWGMGVSRMGVPDTVPCIPIKLEGDPLMLDKVRLGIL